MIIDWDKIFNSINEPISIHDMDFRIIKVNRAFCDCFKKSDEEIIGRHCYEVVHETDGPPDTCPHIRALKTLTHETGEVTCPRLGFPLEVSVSPIFNDDMEIVGAVHIMKDITMRKRREHALMEAEQRHRILLKHLSDAVIIHYVGEVVYINKAGLRILGAEVPGEVIGRNMIDFVHPESKAIEMQRMRRIMEERVSLPTVEERLIRLDGKPFYADVSASPVSYYGKPCTQVIIRDITERKKVEDKLLRKSKELSVLYRISSTINQTIEMDKTLKAVLYTVTSLDILNVEKKGGIMLIEGERMRLVSHLGHSEDFINLHRDIKLGECLCGISAERGEVIISNNSHTDGRHTIKYSDMIPHGHIIIPIKVRGWVIGVLYLYLPPEFEIDEDKLRLLSIIGNEIGIAIENSRLYEETKMVSLHDPLTGLANRRFMDIMLDRLFAEAQRFKKSFSLIMADIDHFKDYNDKHGHLAGDRLLREISKTLQKDTRAVDLVVRYGGEEFVILLTGTDAKTAHKIAEEKRRYIESSFDTTVSFGIATYSEEIKEKDELIRMADSALYSAKQKGRNRVEVM